VLKVELGKAEENYLPILFEPDGLK
jgi:hypothetical protein